MKTNNEPKHGAGWRDAEWQTIQIFRKTEAFGETCYVEVVVNGTKRPYQTANEIRYSWAKMLGLSKRPSDIAVVAVDR